MRKIILRLALVASLFIIFSQSNPHLALAQETPPREPSGQPLTVNVGLYLLNVGKLDTSTGAYTADFYLSLFCDRPCEPAGFEFVNGRATTTDKIVDEPAEKFYRIQAALVSNLNLTRYPFDEHVLTIQIEDKDRTSRTLVYKAALDETGIDPALNVAGWNLTRWEARTFDHFYPTYGTTFSAYQFNVHIKRPVTAALLKSFLPALTIVFVGLLALLLTPDKIIPRLTMTTGSLTGAVLFHLNLTSSIPPVGYLTFADRFMFVNYVALVTTLMTTLLALRYVDQKRPEAAERIHKTAMGMVPALWVSLHVVNFLLR